MDIRDRLWLQQIKLFVVPVGRNDLASFLARSDLWYQRHIFATFTQPLSLCPQFPSEEEFSEGLLMEAGFGESLPVQFLRHTLQDFTRQAKQVLPVCVFDCVCWTDLGAHNLGSEEPTTTLLQHHAPDVIVPFITSAEIGLLTQARIAGRDGAKLSVRRIDTCPAKKRSLFLIAFSSFPSFAPGPARYQGLCVCAGRAERVVRAVEHERLDRLPGRADHPEVRHVRDPHLDQPARERLGP